MVLLSSCAITARTVEEEAHWRCGVSVFRAGSSTQSSPPSRSDHLGRGRQHRYYGLTPLSIWTLSHAPSPKLVPSQVPLRRLRQGSLLSGAGSFGPLIAVRGFRHDALQERIVCLLQGRCPRLGRGQPDPCIRRVRAGLDFGRACLLQLRHQLRGLVFQSGGPSREFGDGCVLLGGDLVQVSDESSDLHAQILFLLDPGPFRGGVPLVSGCGRFGAACFR